MPLLPKGNGHYFRPIGAGFRGRVLGSGFMRFTAAISGPKSGETASLLVALELF